MAADAVAVVAASAAAAAIVTLLFVANCNRPPVSLTGGAQRWVHARCADLCKKLTAWSAFVSHTLAACKRNGRHTRTSARLISCG